MAAQQAVHAVFAAVRRGDDADEVAKLLEAQPDLLEAKDSTHDRSILIEAAGLGHAGIVSMLLGRGANLHSEDRCADTALLRAAKYGRMEVVDMLLRAGAKTSKRDRAGEGTWTALMTAASSGHVGVTRLLLQHMRGEGLNDRDSAGRTALWMASFRVCVEVLRILLLAGADPTIADRQGRTPGRVVKRSPSHAASAAMLQWWEGEVERGYALHLARRVHEDSTTQQQAPGAPVPAYLRQRVERGEAMPRVYFAEHQGGQARRALAKRGAGEAGGEPSEEEKDATIKYVIESLRPDLYIELMEELHK